MSVSEYKCMCALKGTWKKNSNTRQWVVPCRRPSAQGLVQFRDELKHSHKNPSEFTLQRHETRRKKKKEPPVGTRT